LLRPGIKEFLTSIEKVQRLGIIFISSKIQKNLEKEIPVLEPLGLNIKILDQSTGHNVVSKDQGKKSIIRSVEKISEVI